MKWEYQILPITHTSVADIEAELNTAGAEGWELVQVLVGEMPLRAGALGLILKRLADGG